MNGSPIAGRAAWFLASNVTNAGISFLTMIFLARILSPIEYGVLAIFFTFNTVLTSLMTMSLDGSVSVAYFKRTTEELRLHVSSSIAIIAIIFIGSTLLVTFFAIHLASWFHLTIKWLLLGLACAAAQAIINIKLSLWMVKGAAIRYAIFQIAQSVMLACLTFAMIFDLAMNWESRAWALVITTFLFFCGSVFMMVKDGECSRSISISEMRLALRFGVPLIPHTCGALLFTSADRFVVNGVLGPATTGLYQLAAQIGSIVMVGTDSINKAFSPWLYRHLSSATDTTRRFIVKLTYLYFFAAITVSALFFIVPWNIASFFGGESYSEAGVLVPFFILGHCIGGMYFMVVNYIFYTGRTGLLSAATMISGVIGLAAIFGLVGHVGVIGAGIAFVISKAVHFLFTWLISARVFPMPWLLRQWSDKGVAS